MILCEAATAASLLHARHLVTEPACKVFSHFIELLICRRKKSSASEEKFQWTRKILFAVLGFKLAEKSHKIDD